MSLGKLWAKLNSTISKVIENFVVSGYGGIGVDSAATLTSSINSTFQQLVDFDTNLIVEPRRITQDFNSDGLIFEVSGIWQLNIKVALSFDELNSGREIILRAYNVTTATPGSTEFVFFVGRNQGGVNMSVALAFEVPEASVGDLIGLQVGSSADTFTNPVNIGSAFEAVHVSEARFI